MSVLCLCLSVCMCVFLQSSKLDLQTSHNCWWWCPWLVPRQVKQGSRSSYFGPSQIIQLLRQECYHGLRGYASPVLTATGFVNGRWQFSTPTESTLLDRSPRKLVQVITSAAPTAVPNFVQIRPWGLLDKWVKYNEFFIYLFIYTFFSPTHLQVRPIDGFSRLMAQTTRIRARMCFFCGFRWHCFLFWGCNTPKTPIFGAWIGVFKPNGQNIESFMLSKLMHRFKPNFAQR